MSDDLSFADAHSLAGMVRDGDLSPVDLCKHFLQRIERYNPKLQAFLRVTADQALAAARSAETALAAGLDTGTLLGMPVAIKDLIDYAGLPTTGGSTLRRDFVPTESATVAKKMMGAGTCMLGKTGLVEFAFGGVGINHHYGTPWNPWDTDTQRIPGGSSSGSAVAVAAGLAPAALGSDTGGSVRIPASFCGLVGLKTTFGRISNKGIMPLDSSLDSVGPMTRSVRDAALIYQALAGPDPDDPNTWEQPVDEDIFAELHRGVKGLRLSIPREYFWDGVEPEVAAGVRAAADQLASLGANVEEGSLTELDDLIALRARGSIVAVEAYANLKEELENQLDQFDPIVSARMLDGAKFSAVDYFEIKRDLGALRLRMDRTMSSYDALIAPTTPLAAAPVEKVDQENAYFEVNGICLRNTMAGNLLGLCALSVPCGFTSAGLPIGLQLIGRAHTEGRLLRIGQAYEESTEWSKRTPDMAGFD